MKLISIPHTGTIWLTRLVEDQFLVPLEGVHHIEVPGAGFEWVERGGATLVPVRDPVMAACSSINRREPLKMRGWGDLAEWAAGE